MRTSFISTLHFGDQSKITIDLQAVTASESFLDSVDIATVLIYSKWRLKHFFTKVEKLHAYQLHINLAFWRSFENHNRFCERRIGFLKEIINKRISDAPVNMNRTDFRLGSYLRNMKLGLHLT